MAIKLFYKNTYIKEFNANIVHIVEKDDSFHVELNQTAFYPEGGGQPCDEGYIGDIKVSHVYEDKNKIYHVLDKLPSTLENIKCTINWEKRFDHMQQHLGQHILSAAFEKLYDANTIGFHLSPNTATIDVDKVLSGEDIKKVEYFANQIVFNDLLVKVLYPTKEELESLPLRKMPTVTDDIRIVKLDDFDYSPCCGTHPNRSGEVGLIKIRKYEKYKSGLRIDFICGNRALMDYSIKNDITNSLSSRLSAKLDEILNIIDKDSEELQKIKKENKNLKEQIIKFEAAELMKTAKFEGNTKIIKNIFKHRNFNEVKLLSSILANNDTTVIIFAIDNKDKAQLIFNRSKDLDKIIMKDILNKCLPLIDGKGGGSPSTAQGGGTNTDNLEAAISLAYEQIKKIC
ncbi:alanyl-tRNA editing protein [Maledivibacter halophilus]|uniref:Alanine--tRNA ligase n=1 Tax=Maledivibacter halophilus TaxID=36842 RepID=A0A1T5LW56_9FIRM|nr:DHHA1 domain-containing protein [Maledivibacter halophilus]SKC79799.1 alanyl-tRNA synthetase [Maledivibacter halophilus]